MKQIIVYVNRGRYKYDGYIDGDPLEAALSIEVFNAGLVSPDDPDDVLLEKTFAALNAPSPEVFGTLSLERVREYHREYPSLSVGDVVEINGRRYACERLGWRELERKDSDWQYVDAADVAKLVRAVLKERFPETKFSVRTSKYAGGASIDVRYWDGPRQEDVQRAVRPLESYSHMDISDYVHTRKSVHNGKAFHSGARYIFAKRLFSAEFIEEVAARVIAEHELGVETPKVRESAYGHSYLDDSVYQYFELYGDQVNLAELIESEARKTVARRKYGQKEQVTWTNDLGEKVVTTYFRGKLTSKLENGKRKTIEIDTERWAEIKEGLTEKEKANA